MNSKNYITILENEQEAKNHAKPRWQDGKFKPSEKTAGKMLFSPSKRMRMAQAKRQETLDEFFN